MEVSKWFKYKPWKGLLLAFGNIPIGIYLIYLEVLDRSMLLYIYPICLIVALMWAETYEGE